MKRTLLLACLSLFGATCYASGPPCAPVPGETPAIVEWTLDGANYKIETGKAYVQNGGVWEFVVDLYNPNFFSENYVVDGCTVFRLDPATGAMYEVFRQFYDGFENAQSVRDLVGITRGWTGFTLQSPAAPTVEDYVQLRNCILNSTCNFIDSEITVLPAARDSSSVLRTLSVPKTGSMITSKASLESELLHAVVGDRIRVGGWFEVVSGKPYTLIDLESTWISQFPGLRVVLEGSELQVELKWLDKPRFRQVGNPVAFPIGQWVYVEMEALLSAGEDGQVIVRQNGVEIINQSGRTLPLNDTVYNRLEVGVSSNNYLLSNTEVLVDDVTFFIEPSQ